jgi:hypothetical protein
MLFSSPEKREAVLALLMPMKFNWEVTEIMSHFDMNVVPVFAYQMYRAIPGAPFTVFEKS